MFTKLSRYRWACVGLLGILFCLGGFSCTGLESTKKIGLTTKRGDVVNDPTASNILAWMLGGSVLMSSLGGLFYRYKVYKKK